MEVSASPALISTGYKAVEYFNLTANTIMQNISAKATIAMDFALFFAHVVNIKILKSVVFSSTYLSPNRL